MALLPKGWVRLVLASPPSHSSSIRAQASPAESFGPLPPGGLFSRPKKSPPRARGGSASHVLGSSRGSARRNISSPSARGLPNLFSKESPRCLRKLDISSVPTSGGFGASDVLHRPLKRTVTPYPVGPPHEYLRPSVSPLPLTPLLPPVLPAPPLSHGSACPASGCLLTFSSAAVVCKHIRKKIKEADSEHFRQSLSPSFIQRDAWCDNCDLPLAAYHLPPSFLRLPVVHHL